MVDSLRNPVSVMRWLPHEYGWKDALNVLLRSETPEEWCYQHMTDIQI